MSSIPRLANSGSSWRYRSEGLWCPLSPRNRTLSGFGGWAVAVPATRRPRAMATARRRGMRESLVGAESVVSLAVGGGGSDPDSGLELLHDQLPPDVAPRLGREQPDVQVLLGVQVVGVADGQGGGPARGEVLDRERVVAGRPAQGQPQVGPGAEEADLVQVRVLAVRVVDEELRVDFGPLFPEFEHPPANGPVAPRPRVQAELADELERRDLREDGADLEVLRPAETMVRQAHAKVLAAGKSVLRVQVARGRGQLEPAAGRVEAQVLVVRGQPVAGPGQAMGQAGAGTGRVAESVVDRVVEGQLCWSRHGDRLRDDGPDEPLRVG